MRRPALAFVVLAVAGPACAQSGSGADSGTVFLVEDGMRVTGRILEIRPDRIELETAKGTS